ncbi:MAG TPA: hypothetical protein VGB82_05485 [Alphaproteobacteria bacterium]
MSRRNDVLTLLAVVTGLLLAVPEAGAQPAAPPNTLTFQWAPGLEVHNQAYREPSIGVKEDGWFGGGTLDARAVYNGWQLRGEGLLAYGRMDYSGSGTVNGIDDLEVELRVLGAYAIRLDAQGDEITPYAGYGYRVLEDYLGGKTTSTGARGYDRQSQYHYIPMGLEARLGLAPGWSVKPRAEYDYFIRGYQDSYLSQAIAGLQDVRNTQTSGYGVRGSLTLQTNFGPTPVEFGPFVRYWKIQQSDTQPVIFRGVTVAGGFEPANHTTEIGFGFKVWF